tara:strand:- start:272 stop:445 length:174 start_codon:yes stop_codon:yes gene_type:complete
MGFMKKIHYMLENDFNEDKIAWFILCNGKTRNWFECKKIARQMRIDYENENKDTDDL